MSPPDTPPRPEDAPPGGGIEDPWLSDRMHDGAAFRRAETLLHPAVETAVDAFLRDVRNGVADYVTMATHPPNHPPTHLTFGVEEHADQWLRYANRFIGAATRQVFTDSWTRTLRPGPRAAPPRRTRRSVSAEARRQARAFASRVGDRVTGFAERVHARLRRTAEEAAAQDLPPDEVRRRLDDQLTLDSWRGQVMTMTRTETSSSLNAGALAAALDVERATGQPWTKTWLSTPDDKTRPTHRAADRQTKPLTVAYTVGGAHFQFPGDPTAPPGERINCRCTARYAPAPPNRPPAFAATPPRPEADMTTPTLTVPGADPASPGVSAPPAATAPPAAPGVSTSFDHAPAPPAPPAAPPAVAAVPPAAVDAVTADGSLTEVKVSTSGRWRGALGLMDQWSSDMRMLAGPAEGPIRARPLPLPLLVQGELAPGHDKGKLGIGRIDRIWADGDLIMGEGAFDMADPVGAELARKVGEGFVRFVSLDVDDATEHLVCVDELGAFADCDTTAPDVLAGRMFTGWRVMGATLLAYPAFPDAFIALADGDAAADPSEGPAGDLGFGCVVPDANAPTGWAPGECDAPDAVPANEARDAPADAVGEAIAAAAVQGLATPDPFAFTVDTALPWAARDRQWDGDAAAARITGWARQDDDGIDPARMASAFLVVDGPPREASSYRHPVADVVDGKLELVWAAVTAANAALQGAPAEPVLTDGQTQRALSAVAALYRRAADVFADPAITDRSAAADGSYAPMPYDGATVADTPVPAEDRGYGCVRREPTDSDYAERWIPCECDDPGAVTADADGQPVLPPKADDGDDDGDEHESDWQARWREPAEGCADCVPAAITAAAAGNAPDAPGWAPPRDWFADPVFAEPTPIMVDPHTGRIEGHVAIWGTCHVGFADRCITPPHSAAAYGYYATARIASSDGMVDCGVITMDTGHASLQANHKNAVAHYDNTGTQAAVVRVGEDAHGIWVAGSCLPWINADERLRLSLARFSGDWREIRGAAELVAILAVNTPGFPVPPAARRTGADNRDYALVAAGMLPATMPRRSEPPTLPFSEDDITRRVLEEIDRRAARERRMAVAQNRLTTLRREQASARITSLREPWEPFVMGCEATDDDVALAQNWIEKTGDGHLPPYIKRISKHLQEKGMGKSHAIATAVNVVKRMCATGDTNWPGAQNVNAGSRAAACKSLSEWEAKKAEARAK